MVGLVGVAVGQGSDLVDVNHSVELPWQEEEVPSGRRMPWESSFVAGVVVVVVEGWKFEWTAWIMQGRVRMGKLKEGLRKGTSWSETVSIVSYHNRPS